MNNKKEQNVFTVEKNGIFGVFSSHEKAARYREKLIIDMSVAFYEDNFDDIIIKEYTIDEFDEG